jgi:hypothetical protein
MFGGAEGSKAPSAGAWKVEGGTAGGIRELEH